MKIRKICEYKKSIECPSRILKQKIYTQNTSGEPHATRRREAIEQIILSIIDILLTLNIHSLTANK